VADVCCEKKGEGGGGDLIETSGITIHAELRILMLVTDYDLRSVQSFAVEVSSLPGQGKKKKGRKEEKGCRGAPCNLARAREYLCEFGPLSRNVWVSVNDDQLTQRGRKERGKRDEGF